MSTGRVPQPAQASASDADAALIERVKSAHRSFPTGVTIVTVLHQGKPFGLAVNAFSSISLVPPVVLVSVSGGSSTYPMLFENDVIAVNVLAQDQSHVAVAFGTSSGTKFRDVPWRLGVSGAPVLAGVSASFELSIVQRVRVHSHTLFIGQVVDARAHARPPLVYLDSEFYRSDALRPAR